METALLLGAQQKTVFSYITANSQVLFISNRTYRLKKEKTKPTVYVIQAGLRMLLESVTKIKDALKIKSNTLQNLMAKLFA